ncbi:type I restriction-modification system subunit M [Streptococcus equi subsp. zooepidemicus]|uniref:type I restriction-modification system subunit M n=1 Tax=Streptococcus equi TaxID=1336 RepID=UPI001E60AD3F|nr:class I SAM-dependent DNA methyltransferase [Streptococcus equi]MCD3388177.1 type I restriction-modification system subunit M [Streptococcus equi subsp. zooepidemicus]HEL0020521.1 SAM-dependent DNA methyltransferase [Streptococcus equi subsp. zooepidemicus]HEL0633422.1 SAM-dependent DNA methyltransferase [Streptococcus equi subsp. zooepidemicus]HEL0684969.1 SAM-dependent DNA methyltransferase [Streptococcus equi subsp. zooepidemicus]HEL1004780.1 SAM-dependent DNA methyltransferase [Streptoc
MGERFTNENIRNERMTTNIKEKASLIWSIADILRGLYKPHEYGKVILPMTVIKRLHDTLLPTRDRVLEVSKTLSNIKVAQIRDRKLTDTSGYKFYNTSNFTFNSLLSDPDNIQENFYAFLNGFSENVRDILDNFEFDKEISKMTNNDALFAVIQEFNSQKAYLGADTVTSTDMGYIFEELVRRFSESYGEDAGAHFTSRDIIYLMTDILLIDEKPSDKPIVRTIYDQTMGTSQMLSAMMERIKALDANADVTTFGQELNPETYAIAKADTMIRGGNPDNMALGSTLSKDAFSGYTFDYLISNPPFGIDWKKDQKAVKEEAELGEKGRFGAGLPKISDGQLLFQLNGISKLKDTGRMAIIHNGSALFSGNAGGGESAIREYVIMNDWLEAIIQLPTDLFYNTGISTYIWIITKNKVEERRGKVQLLDASRAFVKRRKNIGDKKVDIEKAQRELIVQAYGEFANQIYIEGDTAVESKIFDNNFFGYRKVVVETPMYDEDGNIVRNKNGKATPDTSKRDTEDIPLTEDVDEYITREVLPFNPDAWVDDSKTKIGYEIPFTRLFYKYQAPENSETIAKRIKELEEKIVKNFESLSGQDVEG